MRTVLLILVSLFMFSVVSAQQPFNQVSATAIQHSDGQWYLVLTGDSAEITRICSYGDCGRGHASLIDALNYFGTLLGLSHGFVVQPIPQAPAAQAITQAKPTAPIADEPIKPRDLFCSQLPVGLSCPTGKR